jgi:hypothetical protein
VVVPVPVVRVVDDVVLVSVSVSSVSVPVMAVLEDVVVVPVAIASEVICVYSVTVAVAVIDSPLIVVTGKVVVTDAAVVVPVNDAKLKKDHIQNWLLRFKCLKRYFITDVFSVSNMRVTIVK